MAALTACGPLRALHELSMSCRDAPVLLIDCRTDIAINTSPLVDSPAMMEIDDLLSVRLGQPVDYLEALTMNAETFIEPERNVGSDAASDECIALDKDVIDDRIG